MTSIHSSPHGYVQYIFLPIIILISIFSGIVVYQEIHLVTRGNKRYKDNWFHLLGFIFFWLLIYVTYFISLRHTYHKLTIFLSTDESNRDGVILLITFSISAILNLIATYIFLKTKKNIWKYFSILCVMGAFSIVIYQSILFAKYDTSFEWWLKVLYASELLFALMLGSLIIFGKL